MTDAGAVHGPKHDVIVVGGGPAGLCAALALGQAGIDTGIVLPQQSVARPIDTRTAALFSGSISFLASLGVWDELRPYSAALSAIRVVDGTGAWLRAPEVLFDAREVGLESFGWNVPNARLVAALDDRVRAAPSISIIESGGATGLGFGTDHASIRTREESRHTAFLIVGADGRGSICRAAAGIPTRVTSYEQTAIACQFTHSRPHGGVSIEMHTTAGPCTTVPMPGSQSSLVWVERPGAAEGLSGSDAASFRSALANKLDGRLGTLGEIGPRTMFPLSSAVTDPCARRRVALVGEAAHVLPPIGAQGLNLSLRDAATLAEIVASARAEGRDIGCAETLDLYARRRRADVATRAMSIGLLNRSLLLSRLPPVHFARGAGLAALAAIGPLRRAIMRGGLEPASSLPRSMQTGALPAA